MKAANKSELLENLASYGYPLLQPSASGSAESVLKSLLKQDDVRLLEGFPVVLGNVLKEKESFAWENPKWRPKNDFSVSGERRLACFLALSYSLFKLFGLGRNYEDRVMKLLSKLKTGKQTLADVEAPFMKSESVKAGNLEVSTERLKNNFRNYFVAGQGGEEVQKKTRALELELLLSELFTSKQKNLLRKKSEGKPFSKTEREYFYRVVKKRLKALASDEIHELARTLLLK